LWVLAQNNEVYRINSLTQQVDDYTAAFSAYHNFQFVDIAGRSLDSVYIATNSTNIIRYENNQLHLIQATDGIPGFVNSVGMENGTQFGLYLQNTHVLLIGSDRGFRFYDTNTNKMMPGSPGKGRIYAATYYTAVIKNKQLKAISFKGTSGKSEIQLCSGTATAIIDNDLYNGDIIKWYKDGIELQGENGTTLTINAPGDYNAVFYDPCSALSISSNHLKAIAAADPVFTFNYPDVIESCSSASVTLTVQGDAAYQYRWYKDGVLTSVKTDTYNASQSGKYNVEVSSCSGSWVTSKTVQLDFISLPLPQIMTDKPAYCLGDEANLSLNIGNDDTYTITWSRGGTVLTDYQDKLAVTTNIAGNLHGYRRK